MWGEPAKANVADRTIPRATDHLQAIGAFLIMMLVMMLGGRSVPAQTTPLIPEVGQEIVLGNNLNEEPCRLRRTKTPDHNTDRQDYGVFCEGWTQSSGYIVTFKAGAQFNPQDFLTKGDYAEKFAAWLIECSPAAVTKIAERLAGAVRFCLRREGGWPVVVGSTTAKGRGYVFEMLPTNVPLAERAIDALSTNAAVVIKPAPRTALIQQFEAAANISASQFGVGDIGSVRTLSRLGEEEEWAGRFISAERAWGRVLEIMERVFGAQHPENGHPLSNLALAVFRQGRITESDDMLKRAEPLVQRSRRPDDFPEWMTFRSYLEHRLGRDDAALVLAKQALDRRRDLARAAEQRPGTAQGASSPYAAAVGHSALVLARAYNGLGRFKEAIGPTEEGVQNYIRAHGRTHPMVGWTYLEQAIAYFGMNDLPHARDAATKALAIHDYLYGDSMPVFQDAALAGRIAAQEQRAEQALEYFHRAIRSAQSSSDIELRPSLWLSSYMDLLSAGSGGPADAFIAAQLVRGGVTDEAIRAMAARAAAEEPEIAAVVRTLQEAQASIANLRVRITQEIDKKPGERDSKEEQRLQLTLTEVNAQAAAAEQRLQAQFPRYVRLVRPSQVPSNAVNDLLHPDEALLLAVSGPSATYLFLVRGGQVKMNKAAITSSELTSQIYALRKTLDASETGLRPFDVAGAGRLYETLLSPLAKDLAGVRHLVFVSSGPLLSLPLGVLVRPSPPGAGPAYLARDLAISVVPSVGAFRDLRQTSAAVDAPKPFLGFGDPNFAGKAGDLRGLAKLATQCRADKPVDADEIRLLPRLPETAAELRGIAAALDATPDSIVLGADATKAGLLGRDLAQYRVIAFATHGLLANELECQKEPALVLSLPPEAKKGGDSLLAASDIVGLRLNADWVLLSACNTAGPAGLAGEALSGLTRAFFFAGARSVMATHWPVESSATVRLTTLTFENYAKKPKLGKANALHDAQVSLMDDPNTAHPLFWAPFVLVGDGG